LKKPRGKIAERTPESSIRQVQLLTLKGGTQYRVMKGTPSKSEYETGKTYLHGMENTVLNHE
jgi:hypothetical protein